MLLVMLLVLPAVSYAAKPDVGPTGTAAISQPVESHFEITNVNLKYLSSGGFDYSRSGDQIGVEISFRNKGASHGLYHINIYGSDAAGNRSFTPAWLAIPKEGITSVLNNGRDDEYTYLIHFAHDPANTYYVTVELRSAEWVEGHATLSSPVKRTVSITDAQLHSSGVLLPGRVDSSIFRIPVPAR